jgi:hypothetical protein
MDDPLPIPGSQKDKVFSGNVPEEPNVIFTIPCPAPKHILWDVMTRLQEDGGPARVVEEGQGASPWPKVKDGVFMAMDTGNDEIWSFDPAMPYKYTYRVMRTGAPLFDGCTVTIWITDGEERDTCELNVSGAFSLKCCCIPCFPHSCLLSTLAKSAVFGPFCQKAFEEFDDGSWKEKYKGPTPPPELGGKKDS